MEPDGAKSVDRKEKLRNRIGLIVTICWLAGVAVCWSFIPSELRNMKPNEWADFAAGATAPLAFLWLILGYMQQGDELRQNTCTLEMQKEELHNQVAETQRLVEAGLMTAQATRMVAEAGAKQAELTLTMLNDNRRRAEPKLVVLDENLQGNTDLVGRFANHGGTAGSVTFEFDRPMYSAQINLRDGMMEANHGYTIALRGPFPQDGIVKFRVRCVDLLGNPHASSFVVERTGSEGNVALRLRACEWND